MIRRTLDYNQCRFQRWSLWIFVLGNGLVDQSSICDHTQAIFFFNRSLWERGSCHRVRRCGLIHWWTCGGPPGENIPLLSGASIPSVVDGRSLAKFAGTLVQLTRSRFEHGSKLFPGDTDSFSCEIWAEEKWKRNFLSAFEALAYLLALRSGVFPREADGIKLLYAFLIQCRFLSFPKFLVC